MECNVRQMNILVYPGDTTTIKTGILYKSQ